MHFAESESFKLGKTAIQRPMSAARYQKLTRGEGLVSGQAMERQITYQRGGIKCWSKIG